MIFGLLFILAFLIGLIVYLLSNRWLVGVLVSLTLFVATTLADTEASEYWAITFIFGIPIVVVASILGAYVVELRRGIDEPDLDPQQAEQNAPSPSNTGKREP